MYIVFCIILVNIIIIGYKMKRLSHRKKAADLQLHDSEYYRSFLRQPTQRYSNYYAELPAKTAMRTAHLMLGNKNAHQQSTTKQRQMLNE
jgi:hypothetical protein